MQHRKSDKLKLNLQQKIIRFSKTWLIDKSLWIFTVLKLIYSFGMSITIQPPCLWGVEYADCISNRGLITLLSRVAWFCLLFNGISIFTNPSAREGYDTRSIFKRSLTGLKSEFSFSKTSCLTKAEEPSLPYYLPIARGRIVGFIPFPRV